MLRKNLKITVILTLSVSLFFLGIFSFEESYAQGKGYPEKTIKIISGTQPGGSSDLGTRAWIDNFAKKLGVPVVILNQGGGGGTVAMAEASTAKPDGYTLASVTAVPVISAPAMTKLPYDSTKDFIPIGTFGIIPNLFVVNSNSPFKTFENLLDYARKNPGKLTCGTAGAGTIAHVQLEIVKFYGKVDIVHVPFKTSVPGVTALLGNHVDLLCMTITPYLAHLRAGRVRGLATTDKIKEFPNIPLYSEKGFAEAEIGFWVGLFAPAKIPKDVNRKLVKTFEEVMKSKDVIQRLENVGYIPLYLGPDELAKRIEKELKTISDTVKKAGISLE